jgi:hypothetical protein
MTKQETQKLINQLKADLVEIETERKFVLGQTGIHLPGKTARNYEDELSVLRKRIAELEDTLS